MPPSITWRAAPKHAPLLEDHPAPPAADVAEQHECRKAIQSALASLPPRLHIVVQLGLIEEESYRTIAEALSIRKVRQITNVSRRQDFAKKLKQWDVRPMSDRDFQEFAKKTARRCLSASPTGAKPRPLALHAPKTERTTRPRSLV